MLLYYCTVQMLHQKDSPHNVLEMSNKACSKMWEPLLWFRFSLDLNLPQLNPKQESLEYGLLVERRKSSAPALLLQVVSSSFLNQIPNAETLLSGKYQNYSCQRFCRIFLVFVCLFVSTNIICWINLKFKTCSDQLHMAYLLLKEGRKQASKMQFCSGQRHFIDTACVKRLRNITRTMRWVVSSVWHIANFNSILRTTREWNSSPCRKLQLNLQNKALTET